MNKIFIGVIFCVFSYSYVFSNMESPQMPDRPKGANGPCQPKIL